MDLAATAVELFPQWARYVEWLSERSNRLVVRALRNSNYTAARLEVNARHLRATAGAAMTPNWSAAGARTRSHAKDMVDRDELPFEPAINEAEAELPDQGRDLDSRY
jgi:hypothetical protein